MSRIGPASKQGLKLAAKYGPHVKAAWDLGGDKVKEVARAKADEVAARNKAFKDADARVQGSVLRVPHDGVPVFVVFAGDEPVTSYPAVDEPLDAVVARVDLAKRISPEQRRERQLRARAMQAARKARSSRRAPRSS